MMTTPRSPSGPPGSALSKPAEPPDPGNRTLEPSQEIDGHPPDRRADPRYSPDPMVPVLFAHPAADMPTAGLVIDISEGGARIVAPPTARPHLHWGDPLTLLVSYSDSAREAGIEGLTLGGTVVRIGVDASGYTLAVRFDRSNVDWSVLEHWIRRLEECAR